MKKCILLTAVVLSFASELTAQNIFVNQVGHRPQDRKDFRLNTAADSFEILNDNGTVLYEAAIVKQEEQDAGAQEDVWVGDFSSFDREGDYTIRLNDGRQSDTISIKSDLYDEVFQTALRGLYVMRCTYAVQDDSVGHGVCHRQAGKFVFTVKNAENLADSVNFTPDDRDVAGGWHNGGDYRRSTLSAAQTVNRILATVESFPDKFRNYPSILGPGEGIGSWPDILVEAKWGLDWLVNMQDNEGGVPTGLGPTENSHPSYNTPPEGDSTDYFIGTVYSANTGKTGAVLAKAARIFEEYDPDLASTYLEKAVMAYEFLEENGGIEGAETINSYEFNGGWVEDFMWLSLELYLTTEDPQYHTNFVEQYRAIADNVYNLDFYDGTAFPPESVDTHTLRSENLHEVLLNYCRVEDLTTDETIKNEIWEEAKKKLKPLVDQWRTEGYGYVLPPAFWADRHTVGNMLHKAWTLLLAYRASQVMEDQPLADHRDAALDQVNIMLGRNTLDMAFVTGVGRRFVTDPHLRLTSLGGVPPGMPVKGPTYDSSFRANLGDRVAEAPAKNYVDNVTKHWVNEPDVEATSYFIAFTGYLASDGNKTAPDPNQAVQITAPAPGTTYGQNESITLRAVVADETNVVKIEFFRNEGIKLGDANNQYAFTWYNISVGEQRFTARLTDSEGNVTVSDTVTVVVTEDSSPAGQITIRAQGDCGKEMMELHVNGSRVAEWTVSTIPDDYTYEDFNGGEVSVHFVNDRYRDGGACEDNNLTVDYITVCGTTTYQTEEVATETATCCQYDKQKLYTNGNFSFGSLLCDGTAQAQKTNQFGNMVVKRINEVRVYPNPAQGQITVWGTKHYDLTLYNLHGRVIQQWAQRSGLSQLKVASVPPGVYLLQVLDTRTQQTHREKLILE